MKQIISLFIGAISFCIAEKVIAQNSISFTADKTEGCAPLTVNFTNTSSIGTNFYWAFDDGTGFYFNGADTSHTFNTMREYNVNLYAYDANYNYLGNVQKKITVKGKPSDFWISQNPACPNENISFQSWDAATAYSWDFGDASAPATEQYVNHSYSGLGDYAVTLSVTTSCGTDTIKRSVSINNTVVPNAGFGFWPNSACPTQPVNFYPYQDGVAFKWYFGNGDSSAVKYPNYAYSSSGDYTVTLMLTNNCGNTGSQTNTVNISDDAGFPSGMNINKPAASCPGEDININTDNGYMAYLWNYGDGTPPDSTNNSSANHTYNDTGKYVLSVKIYNFCGKDTILNDTAYVKNNIGFNGQSDFTLNPDSACPGSEVNLYINNSGSKKSYVWDYGDGSPVDSTIYSNRNHVYFDTSDYIIRVTVQNFCGIDTMFSDTLHVKNNVGFPGGADLYLDSPRCPGEQVGLNAPWGHKSYIWEYGDSSPNDTMIKSWNDHTYNDTGTYSVKLTVVNHCNISLPITKSLVIDNNVGFSGWMNINFNSNPACPGSNFRMWAPGGYVSYEWTFGDGTTANSTRSDMDHQYDSVGNYNVTVKIQNACGRDTTITGVAIIDAAAGFPQWIYFDADPSVTCPGDAVRFSTDEGYASYFWSFGDGDTVTNKSREITHKYDSAGTYYTSLKLTNFCGNQTTLYKPVKVDNNALISDVGVSLMSDPNCPGDAVNFSTDKDGGTPYKYIYNFGDGNTDTVFGSATHIYQDTGKYTVSVTAINGCGNSKTTSVVANIQNGVKPTLRTDDGEEMFGTPGGDGGTSSSSCPGDAVLFYFFGTYSNVWDFGDGNSGVANQQLIIPQGILTTTKHIYSDTGTYYAKLTVTSSCGLSTTDSVMIKVKYGVGVAGELFIPPATSQLGYNTCEQVTFIGFGGSSYVWDFGDGKTLTTTNPTVQHLYSTAGSYLVNLKVTNACGGSAAYSSSITINQGANAVVDVSVTKPVTCFGGSDATAVASTTGGSAPFTYSWSGGQTTDTAAGLSAGTQTVNVIDAYGCQGSASAAITNPPKIDGTGSITNAGCGQSTGSITLTMTTGKTPFTYLWNDAQSQTTAMATGLAAGSYSLYVIDADNCSNSKTITVSETNGPAISETLTNVSCKGNADGSIAIVVSGGTAPYLYSWSTDAATASLSALTAGAYTLTVTDSAGCKSVSSFTITEPDDIIVTSSSTDATCGTEDGSVTVSVTGGTSPYSYSWIAGGTTAALDSIAAGAYLVTVTDAMACTKTSLAIVANANAPVIVPTITNVSCNGMGDGTILLTISGGTSSFTYLWLHNGNNTNYVSGLNGGNYTVIVDDAAKCRTAQTITVVEPAVLSVSATKTNSHCLSPDGSISTSVTGGTTPYTYSWNGGETTATLDSIAAASYTVAVTDANGCSKTAGAIVSDTIEAIPVCVITVDSTSTKNIVVWEKPVVSYIDSFMVYRDSIGIYSYIGAVDYNALSEFTDNTNGVNPAITSYRYKLRALDNCGNVSDLSSYHETIHLSTNLGNGGVINLSWNSYKGFDAGTYYNILRDSTGTGNYGVFGSVSDQSLSYTDLNPPVGVTLKYVLEIIHPSGGCTTSKGKSYSSSKSNTSQEISSGVLTAGISDSVDVSIVGACDGSATVSATGGNGVYTYLWNDPASQTTQTATGLCAGTFTVKVTDGNGDIVNVNATIDVATGIGKSGVALNSIKVYPNPNNGEFVLQITNSSASIIKNMEIRVFNILGEVVYNQLSTTENEKLTINLTHLQSGIYNLQVIADDGVMNSSVIIK